MDNFAWNQQGVRFIRVGNQGMSIPMNTFSRISLPTCLDELGDTGPMSTESCIEVVPLCRNRHISVPPN